MKRAEVCKLEGDWAVFECTEKPSTRYPIGERAAGIEHPDSPFRSYREALDAALAAVGLDRPAEHREAP